MVLCTRAAAHPNGSDELSVYENGIAARRCNDPVDRQQRQPRATGTYSFFEGLARWVKRVAAMTIATIVRTIAPS